MSAAVPEVERYPVYLSLDEMHAVIDCISTTRMHNDGRLRDDFTPWVIDDGDDPALVRAEWSQAMESAAERIADATHEP